MKRIGSIIHGALGDCYEQLLCLQKYKATHGNNISLIGFFAVESRYRAFLHYDLSLFDEIYSAEKIGHVAIDSYYQFQFRDEELQPDVISKLSPSELIKFDVTTNLLPWHILKTHNYRASPLSLILSIKGQEYLAFVKEIHGIIEDNKKKVGFLWRHRNKGLNSSGQYPKHIIKNNISEVMNYFVKEHNAHIYVCGMGAGNLSELDCYQRVVDEGGIALGEHKWKFDPELLDIEEKSVTYLMGTGYAAEMEIMSQCDILVMMPSGFSEPLWMRNPGKVVMVYPPFEYLLKLWKHRVPFFDNDTFSGKWFNSFTFHSSKNIHKRLRTKKLLM
jgi:hypothetical protein